MLQHSNRLSRETSPYLLQHARNPVDWYPWGDEALERAKREDKPILISIGYSACHWCHVMERESFEDEETAAVMNEHFINIKIDREERPDLDHIYMDAVQAITGSGGWPLNVFLTPEIKPFFGGTYFPPVKSFNRASWKEVLTAIIQSFRERRAQINEQAEKLTSHLEQANSFGQEFLEGIQHDGESFSTHHLNLIFDNIMQTADAEWGGFGRAPKFPQTLTIEWLFRYNHFTGRKEALDQALLSLDKMIHGGIYDQLGGGFARYSTDKEWLVPHFEKMLYDNALLITVLSEAYQITKRQLYADTIRETIGFVRRELMDQNGGFYSALDADSEGVEGKFYVWSRNEIGELLKEDADLFCRFYDVTDKGNWEHTNILRVLMPLEKFAVSNRMDPLVLEAKLRACRELLFAERKKRARPLLDDKVLLGWNALMNFACSKAYAALGDELFRDLAKSNMEFMLKFMSVADGNAFFHSFKEERAKFPAFLDDYACLVRALIHLQEITGDQDYLLRAKGILEYVQEQFSEAGTGFFFYTAGNQKDVIVRKKEVYDGATPSGNAIMAWNLQYLSSVFDIREWRKQSRQMTDSLAQMIIKYPGSFAQWAMVLMERVWGGRELVVVGDRYMALLDEILRYYIPLKVLQSYPFDNEDFPLLKQRFTHGKSYLYWCRDYSCLTPVENVADLLQLIDQELET
jgi:uncharacterized protein YyaL (SSP411 family)